VKSGRYKRRAASWDKEGATEETESGRERRKDRGIFGCGGEGGETEAGQRHHQPEAFGASGVDHAGTLPMKASSFERLEAGLNPPTEGVPGWTDLSGCQIGDQHPNGLLSIVV